MRHIRLWPPTCVLTKIEPATQICALEGKSHPWPFGVQANTLTTEPHETGQSEARGKRNLLYHPDPLHVTLEGSRQGRAKARGYLKAGRNLALGGAGGTGHKHSGKRGNDIPHLLPLGPQNLPGRIRQGNLTPRDPCPPLWASAVPARLLGPLKTFTGPSHLKPVLEMPR